MHCNCKRFIISSDIVWCSLKMYWILSSWPTPNRPFLNFCRVSFAHALVDLFSPRTNRAAKKTFLIFTHGHALVIFLQIWFQGIRSSIESDVWKRLKYDEKFWLSCCQASSIWLLKSETKRKRSGKVNLLGSYKRIFRPQAHHRIVKTLHQMFLWHLAMFYRKAVLRKCNLAW